MEEIINRAAELVRGFRFQKIGAGYLVCDYSRRKAIVKHSRNPQFCDIEVDLDEGLVRDVIRSRQIQFANDYWKGIGKGTVYDKLGLLHYLKNVIEVPVIQGEEVIGIIAITDEGGERRFGPEDVQMLSPFAELVAITIQNARLVSEERKLRQQAEMLHEISQMSSLKE